MKEGEKVLDPQLWHACAGGMVQMPQVHSKVFYFPQGHAEHAHTTIDLRVPPFILCNVEAVKFMADPETDQVFAKLSLVPLRNSELGPDSDSAAGDDAAEPSSCEKPASFAKTLTQSDANNGGGFSVPRYCAETIFPRLDCTAEPPVQTVVAKDVHGETWRFRHIYRGTPRRHLLTTGWSSFVNQKKLVAGDSVVFLRAENGDLCVGIRRAKKGIDEGSGLASSSVWSSASGSGIGPFSFFLKEENKMLRNGCGVGGNLSGRVKVRAEDVVEAVTLAASNKAFEVVYYPRASTPEFCVKASSVGAAMRIQWCSGMRFKMAFETEDATRISWFMGTIASVQVVDPICWPNSPWRLLQVTWDEPDLLQNVKRVSPWLVELVSNIPLINFTPFSPPRKKLRPQHPDFPLDVQFPIPMLSGNQHGPNSPLCGFSDNAPAGIQGARHAQFGKSLSDLHLNNNKLQLGMLPTNIHQLGGVYTGISSGNMMTKHDKSKESLSCFLTMGKSSKSLEKSDDVKKHQFLLFGQPILTEQQISSCSRDVLSRGKRSLGDEKVKAKCVLDDSQSTLSQQFSPGKASSAEFFWQLGLDTGHCKVFLESEDVGRTLDLSQFGSYEELYRRLGNMFGIERSEILNHVLYYDAAGAVKQTGEEPFSDFMKTAKRLTILTDSGSKNIKRLERERA
ncbi:Auxin response factor 18 isoform B [Glycine soja]|uniref:Auxin response factor n=1 Tax=Glycine soja TaxID=3848 RepID=A0A445I3I6_GLYSO|nr:Auxin response factor 18 isoform B [Glycine soja]